MPTLPELGPRSQQKTDFEPCGQSQLSVNPAAAACMLGFSRGADARVSGPADEFRFGRLEAYLPEVVDHFKLIVCARQN